MKDVPIGSLGIGSDRAVHHAADPDPRQLGEHPHEAGLGLDPVDRRQRAGDGLDAKPLGPRLVHVRGVQVADLLFGVRCVLAGVGTALDDGADVLFGLFGQGREGAVIGAVGGDLGLGEPGAVDRAEQIVLETHGRVEVGPIDAAGERLGGFALRRAGRQQRESQHKSK